MGLILVGLLGVAGRAVAEPRRVLMIYSFGRDFAPFDTMASVFRTTLAGESTEPVEFHEASIETARFSGTGDDGPLLAYLRALFAERRLDLIVAFAEPAVQFSMRHRAELFPDVPLVAHVDHRQIPMLAGVTNAVVVPVRVEIPVLMENVLGVFPDTTNVVMVLGASPFERYWADICRRDFAAFTNRVSVEYTSDLGMDAIRGRVRRLPPRTAILYGMLAVDAAGVPYEQERALAGLREVANAPLFGVFESHLGLGVVGGRLLSLEWAGRQAADMGLRLLRGEKAGSMVVPEAERPKRIYDWRELRRWNVPASRVPADSEIRFRQPTFWEEYKWQLIGLHALCLVEGILIFVLLRNRRRLRRTQDRLLQSEARLSLATNSAKVGVWSWDIPSGAIEATPECKQLFGFAPTVSVTFEAFMDRVHPEDRDFVRLAVEEAMRTQSFYDTQYRIVLGDGSVRWIAARGREHRLSGRGGDMLGVVMDITDRKRSEEEAQRHRQELAHVSRVSTLGELAASVAHELNQPLGAILSNAEAAELFLNRTPPALDELREILADIRKDDERAGEVIRRMRSLLRKQELEHQPLTMNGLVEDVLCLVATDAALRRTPIHAELTPEVLPILGDRIHLQQVVLNLMVNGMEAMARQPAEQRRLVVRTERNADGAAEVAVIDAGPGIHPGALSRVFEPFYTTKQDGMGMGLSIAQTIIQAHRGRIWAENNPEGGATFRFVLPLASAEG